MIAGFLWVTEPQDLARCFTLREQVFMQEQGFSYDQDEQDADALHLLFLDDELPVGTLRLFLDGDDWHVGRICVKQTYRGNGIGRFLVEECIQKAREQGRAKRLILGSQLHARGFYEALGFTPYGEPFLDDGAPHVHMQFQL